MTTNINLKKLDAAAGRLEMVNALGATLGFEPCADTASFIALLDEKIGDRQAELVKLASMRDMVAKLARARPGRLLGQRPRKPWNPGAHTVSARVRDLIRQHGILARQEIVNLLTTDAGGAVPLGSISAALSKLAEEGVIERDAMGWKLSGADTGETE